MSRKIKRKANKKESFTLPNCQGMDRITADLGRLLQGQNFKNIDEANAFIKNLDRCGELSSAKKTMLLLEVLEEKGIASQT